MDETDSVMRSMEDVIVKSMIAAESEITPAMHMHSASR
jgi:hypothetical protein